MAAAGVGMRGGGTNGYFTGTKWHRFPAMDSASWDQRYRGTGLVWTGEPNRFVRQFLADAVPGVAVDLGAGEGRNAVWLAQRGWRVTAVDFSAVGLAKARSLAESAGVTVQTEVADALEYSPPQPVDLVVLSYLQLPDEEQERLLRRIPAWLTPGGLVLVVAHDKSNVADGWGGPPDTAVCYDAEATAAALDGLSVEFCDVLAREVVGGDRPARDTVVLARRR